MNLFLHVKTRLCVPSVGNRPKEAILEKCGLPQASLEIPIVMAIVAAVVGVAINKID